MGSPYATIWRTTGHHLGIGKATESWEETISYFTNILGTPLNGHFSIKNNSQVEVNLVVVFYSASSIR